MYTVCYHPAMDAILNLIEDPDLRGVLNLYPQQHYMCDPHGGPNMRVWTDVHMADDWWSLQVLSPISLSPFALMIDSRIRLDQKRLPSICSCTLMPHNSTKWGQKSVGVSGCTLEMYHKSFESATRRRAVLFFLVTSLRYLQPLSLLK